MRGLVVLSVLLIACGGSNSGTGGPDASGDSGNGSGSGSGSGNVAPCKAKVTSYGSGHHNAGQDCMNSCHNHGFTLAGTLYSSASGGSTVAGASITVKDATGHTFDMVTQANGNFYTSTGVTFPVTVYASECQISQTSQVMMTALTSSNRGCNQSGCHTTSGQGRIHLP